MVALGGFIRYNIRINKRGNIMVNDSATILSNIVGNELDGLIYEVRGRQVMLDSDLAELYGTETKYINLAVKRNAERFPEEFYFQLTKTEQESLKPVILAAYNSDALGLRLQTATVVFGKNRKVQAMTMRRNEAYVFTEQGIAMLSACLHTPKAVQTSIYIMDAFVKMRQLILKQYMDNRVVSVNNREVNELLLSKIENIDKENLEFRKFLIVDDSEFYSIGASLKDAGKKHFYVGKIESEEIKEALLEKIKDMLG